MREQQNPSTPELHQPLLFAPSELLACGLRDAHHHPLVGVRTEGRRAVLAHVAGDGVGAFPGRVGTHGQQLLLDRPRLRFERESRARVCGRGGLRRSTDGPTLRRSARRRGICIWAGTCGHPCTAARRRDRGHSRHSAASRSTTRSRSARIVAMWASWPTTPSTATTTPFIRALSPTIWRSWLALSRPTGDGQRERRTWYRHRGATAICSRRSASWPLADRTRAC